MPIDADEVRRIAALAHLDLDPATVEAFRHQVGAVLDYVAVLEELDVSDVAPMAHALEGTRPWREDAVVASLSQDEALRNAPDARAGHFRVPRVLGG